MASNGKIPNMKVVDLRKLRNFVVDKFLIWIYLVPQKSDLHSVLYSMTRTKTAYGCIWVCGVVVEEASREVEVTRVQTTASAESRDFYAKKCTTCDLMTSGWLARGVPPIQKVFFVVHFRFLSANPENLSAVRWLKHPPELGPYAGRWTPAITETICAGTRSLAGAPPTSKDPFYPPAQIVCGLVKCHT
jgi:hypothetical protein